jgi:hypothetical protein
MAKAKTGSFYISEQIVITNTTSGTATHDISALIDVANRQGLRILEADFLFQDSANTAYQPGAVEDIQVQVTDQQESAAVPASDNGLIASGQLLTTADGQADRDSDLYPDNYAGEGKLVVNDTLYYRVDCSQQTVNVTVRLLVEVVKISAKDFMAIALQSAQSDN